MQMQVLVARKATALTFTREFEALLLNSATDHISLTHDLELQVLKGLDILEELEDAHDIKHIDVIRDLIVKTNYYMKLESKHFQQWYINIAEDILDEVDLMILAHGDDLGELGLETVTEGSILILLALAGLTNLKIN